MRGSRSRTIASWTPEETGRLRQLWPTAINTRSILASFPGRTPESLRSKARGLGLVRTAEATHAAYFTRPQSVARRTWDDIPKLNKFLHLSGDIALSADWHVPMTDAKMIEGFCRIAKRLGIRQCAILGDFFDADAFSHWVAMGQSPLQVKFGDELQYAAQAMETLIEAFPAGVHFLRGNHDERPLRLLRFALESADIYAMLGRRMAKGIRDKIEEVVRVSEYPFCHLNESWLLCHPSSYSKIPMAVARDVAEVEDMHVVCGNGHLWGLTRDRSGRYYCVDTGAMCEREKVWYAVMRIRRFPRWVNGFTMIQDNLPSLYDSAMMLSPARTG